MKLIKYFAAVGVVILFAVFSPVSKAIAQTEQLITQLAAATGISEQQVDGGIGALMKYVQQSLEPEQFARIADALPKLAGLVDSAPPVDQSTSTVTQLSTLLGDDDTAGKAEKIMTLRNSLDSLGLSSEQIAQFVPAIVDYAKSRGGGAIANLLKQALPTL